MKKVHNLLHLWMLMVFFLPGLIINAQDLIISGIGDGPLPNGTPKVLELYVVNDISDLSAYTIKNQTNANTTWGSDYTLSGSATAGDFIYLTSTGYTANFNSFFENTLTPLENGVINLNGNDRIAIFDALDNIVDIFGEDGVDGTGTAWEYLDGWAYRNNFTSPSSTFDVADWSFSGINGLEGGTTNATCTSPMPIGTFTLGGGCPASIPFFDGFEADQTDATPLAGCWTQESVTTADTWMANSSLSDYNRTPRTGSFNAYLKYNNQDWMFYALDLTGGISYTVKLYAIQDATSGADLTVAYGISGDAASMTNTIVPATAITNGSYQEIIGTFTPATTGTYYIGILGELTYSPWYLSIDDFEVYESPTATLTWYNLQHPAAATILTDETFEVFAQAWEDGLTNADAGAPGAGIECWIGYSDTDSDPSSWTNWVPAVYNTDVGNNDEFKAELGTFAAGTYYYASRWRLDGGPFTYGGYNIGGGGPWDGTTNVSGVLTVNAILGSDCTNPFTVDIPAALPYSDLNQTNCSLGDVYDDTNISNTNYDTGEDAIYEITVTADTYVRITLDPKTTTYASVSLFDGCPDVGALVDDDLGSAASPKVIETLLSAGTYFLMVDTWTSPDCIPDYDLTIEEFCPAPANILAEDLVADAANITWTASVLGETSWNIKVNATNTIDPTTTDGDIVANDAVNTTPLYALSSLTPATAYYVYVQSACGSDWVEYMFTTPASCPVPTGLSSLVTGASTATLTWDELGEAAWNIKINEGASIDPETETATIESTATVTGEYLATGLNGNTTYYWYVQSDCGSAWSAEGVFTTDCDVVSALPFVQSFDDATFAPDCWTNVKTAGSGTGLWNRVTTGTNPTTGTHSGTGMARFNCYSYTTSTAGILVSPQIDIPDNTYVVEFWMYRDNAYATNADLVNVYYNATNDLTGATLLGTINRSTTLTPVVAANGWYNYSFPLPVGTNYVILEAVSAYGNNIFVDDFAVRALSDENDILTFSLTEQTATPVVIDDMNHTVSIEVAMGTDLTALSPTITISDYATINPLSGTAQNFTGSDVTPFEYTVTSELGTDQIWQVSVIEAATQSSEKDILTFELAEETAPATIGANTIDIEVAWDSDITNLTPTITVSPLATVSPLSGAVQDFTSPVTYTVTAEDATTKDYIVTVSLETAPLGANCSNPFLVNIPADLTYQDLSQTNCGLVDVYDDTNISNTSYDTGEDAIYELTVTADTYVRITLDPKTTTYASVSLFDGCPDVGALVDDDLGSAASPKIIETLLSAGTYFLMVDTWTSPDCIPDYDLTIEEVCPAPTNILAEDLVADAANITWTASVLGETSWNIKVNATNTIDPTTTDGDIVANDVVNTTPLYALSSLTPTTAYYVYVQSACGSDWVEYMFTTPASCPVPTDLFADNITTTGATLNWTDYGETSWNIVAATAPFDPTVSTGDFGVISVSTNPFTIPDGGLTPSTTYYWYIQSACGSDWSAENQFTTECGVVTTLPFVESFDNATFAPICWTNVKTAGTGTGLWNRVTTGTSPTTGTHSGAGMARFNCYSYTTSTAGILVTPQIDIPDNTYIVDFWMYRDNGYATNTDLVNVYYNATNDLTGATLLGTINRSTTLAPVVAANGWYNYSFPLPAGINYVILEAVSAYGNNIFVDDFAVRTLSDENDILTFSLAEQTATPVVIDDLNHTVSIEVAMGTDLTALSPTITISDYATINPLSGVAQDFTGSDVTPFEYTVTSELGTDQIWQVSVIEATTQSSEKDILTFELAEETGPATIGANTVDIEVNFMADVTNLTPTVTVSPLATVSPESGIVQDFTSPVTYTVTAEDATTKDYTVTVTKEGTPLGAGCDNPIPYTNINDPEVVTAISNISRELWFTVTLDQTYVNVEFSTCASVYDTKLYVYDACGGTQLAYDDDAPTDYCSVDNNQSLIEMESLDAGTYYVLITTYSATTDISDPTTGLLVTGSNCGTPVDLIESNLTMTTADLSWTPLTAETGWNIKINEATSIDPTTVDGDIVANDAVTPNPEYSVSGLTAETDYYVYVQADCGSDWIEYMFTTPAACPVPTGLMATVLGANDVDLAWNELGTTDWVLEVSTTPLADPSTESGDILDDESVLGATGEYSLTGLDANTTYYWYVQSACGSAWSAQGVFTTECDLVTEFTQGFDLVTTPALPDCWFKVGTTGTANTQANNNQSAPNCLYMYSSGATSVATVAMQPVSNAGDDTHQLRFSARANFTTGAIIEVGYLTDPSDASSFVLLSSETLTLTYQEFTVIPGTAPGINTYFAFRAQHVPAYSLLIDDVNWEPIPTCPKPIDLFADNITSSSADLNWTEAGGAGTWNIKVNKATAIDPTTEDGNIIANESTMDNPYTSLAGLDPATTYYFYVQADCGGGDLSAWSTAGMFTTECAAITTFPYSEPFDTYLPTVCWSEGKNGDLTTGPVTVSPTASNWIADGFGNVGTTGAAKINIYSTADSDWLISPEFELPVSPELSVLYDVAATQWNTTTAPTTPWEADDYVEFAIYAGGTWTALATYNSSNVPSNTGQTELLDIAAYAGQIVQFAFRAVEGASDGGADIDFFVDNLEIRQLPQIADIDINSDAVDVEVCEGTLEADAIAALATQITITDTDAAEHVVDLTWTIASYDANTPADYTATGTFTLPVGVVQSDPVTPLEVTALVTVTAPVEPTFSFTTEYCLNSTADALPTISDNGIEGAWAPSTIATDVAGSADYIFTPLTGECATGTSISVTINDLPVVTCPETVNVAVDEPVTFTGQDPVGGTFSGTGVVGDTFDPNGLANDTYVITYTYTDPVTGCENSCDFNVIVDIDINVADVTVEGIGIYPNPNNGEFVINFNNIEGNVTYQLYDTKGSIIILKDISTNGNTVEEISVDLVPGVYYVKVVTAAQTYVEKLVVE